MMFFNFLLKSVGFVERIVKWRFKCRVLFKYLSLFVARVNSARVGDASLYDRHFVTTRRSGLTHVLYCSLPTTGLNNAC